jgi:hypothetical protein
MSNIKNSEWPFRASQSWMSDFFDSERFFDSEWLKKKPTPGAANVKAKESVTSDNKKHSITSNEK